MITFRIEDKHQSSISELMEHHKVVLASDSATGTRIIWTPQDRKIQVVGGRIAEVETFHDSDLDAVAESFNNRQ